MLQMACMLVAASQSLSALPASDGAGEKVAEVRLGESELKKCKHEVKLRFADRANAELMSCLAGKKTIARKEKHDYKETHCSGWSPKTGKWKGAGATCAIWGWSSPCRWQGRKKKCDSQTAWCYVTKVIPARTALSSERCEHVPYRATKVQGASSRSPRIHTRRRRATVPISTTFRVRRSRSCRAPSLCGRY